MKSLMYRVVFLCAALLPAATGLVHAQAPCRKFVQASHGGFHALAIAEDGTLWAWGYNYYGQLGNGTTSRQSMSQPEQVGTDRDWKWIRATQMSSMAGKNDGTLWAWGQNLRGELGIGNTVHQSRPVQVGTDRDWAPQPKHLDGGDEFAYLTIKPNGSLWFWGGDGSYMSGLSDDPPYNIPHLDIRPTPTQVGDGTYDWKEVSSGGHHVIALKTDGTLWGWGMNYRQCIGHGSAREGGVVKVPFRLGTATDWKTISAGGRSNWAIKNDGTLWAWGDNSWGELGNGRVGGDDQPIATQVGTDRDWKSVVSGYRTVYAQKNDGSYWAWGKGSSGEYGNGDFGTTANGGVPTPLGNYESLTAGSRSAIAFRSDGSLWIWGELAGTYPSRVYSRFLSGTRLAIDGDAQTLSATDWTHYFEKDCRLICTIDQPQNRRQGMGNRVTARVWVDGPKLFGGTYTDHVRRHYEIITPTHNSVVASGRVTLYFTDEDFQEFNRVAANLKKLPSGGPDDRADIANLLIEQRSGVSADGSGRPASYPGTPKNISPIFNGVGWSSTYKCWTVKFDIEGEGGFGGFWIKTTGRPLPVAFGSIAARLQGGSLWVDFTSEKETNNHHYEIEASTDGKTFKKIGELRSQAPNGNSDTPISYTFKTPVSGIMGAAGIAGIVLLALMVTPPPPPRWRLPAIAIAMVPWWGVAACVKHSREPVAHHSPKIWVRIAQVDKDGTKEYSKIVQAVAKD